MAKALGKTVEQEQWEERAEKIRNLIIEKLYVPEDGAFYDLDAENHFVRTRSDVLSRVCGEHVLTHEQFENIWQKQLHRAKAFWAPYPLPSIALDDPSFVRPIPRNSWGGASQALTALRAPRWVEFYRKPADLAFLMERWSEAIERNGSFHQQLDPLSGEFTQDPGGYSPAALVMVDFTWRLAGVREEGQALEWNIRPGHRSARNARFTMSFGPHQTATMKYERDHCTLLIDGHEVASLSSGTVRVTTHRDGRPTKLTSISPSEEAVVISFGRGPERRIKVEPNKIVDL